MGRANQPSKGITAAAATKVVTPAAKSVVDSVAEKASDFIQGDTSTANATALAGGPTARADPAPADTIASPIVEVAAEIAAEAVIDALGLDAAPSIDAATLAEVGATLAASGSVIDHKSVTLGSAVIEAAAEIAADAVVDALGLDAAPSLRVTALQPERRRAGFKFTSIAETISAAFVKLEQLHALVSDPVLRVEVSADGVDFKVLNRDDLPPLPARDPRD